MQSNLGVLDKSIRITLAFTSLAIYFLALLEEAANYLFLITAVLLILTAALNYCPLYGIWHISTKEHQEG
jgi:hypothetical protein